LLYLAGEDRARDLSGDLGGLIVRTVVIYRAIKVASLPSSVQAALDANQLDGVLHFSRRTTEAYVACAQAADLLDKALAPLHFCLSARVAEPLVPLMPLTQAANIRTAARPDEAALLDLVSPL